MGLFKSLKKLGSNIVRGVKKVFKKVGQAVAKFASSDLGKAILIIMTVASLGTALAAGHAAFSTAFAGGNSILNASLKGAEAFLSSYFSIGQAGPRALETRAAEKAAAMAGTAATAAAPLPIPNVGMAQANPGNTVAYQAAAANPGQVTGQQFKEYLGSAAFAGAGSPDVPPTPNVPNVPPTPEVPNVPTTPEVPKPPVEEKNFLQKASDFVAKHGQIIGPVLSGAAGGQAELELLERQQADRKAMWDKWKGYDWGGGEAAASVVPPLYVRNQVANTQQNTRPLTGR